MNGDLLLNRKIFITGGSRGIGEAIVRRSLESGAFVGFSHIGSKNVAADTTRRSTTGSALGYKIDTKDDHGMATVLSDFSSRGPKEGIDGLVVNAGIYNRNDIRNMERDDWDRTIAVNLTGAFNAVKAALPHMKNGSIVMISSQLAFRGSTKGADYAASKAGMLGFARSIAKELAPDIRVNSVAPGFVDTDILSGDSEEKRRSREIEVPLGRIGTPTEVAEPVIFLLSDMSSYMTGTTIDINGGLFIH